MMEGLFQPLDYIFISIGIIIIVFSFLRGLVNSILGLFTWIGSIFITFYSYEYLSGFIETQLINTSFLNEEFSYYLSMGLAIPIIFLLSIFLLKKIRKILSTELDKGFIGLILDKIFGLIFGFIYCYIIISTLIFCLNKYEFFQSRDIDIWFNKNSNIIKTTENYNNKLLKYITISEEEIIN
jgi:uncharacterized membrane protein required for colicin V production